jgi:hypothetical protein
MFIRTDACQKITYYFVPQVLVLMNALTELSVLRLVHVIVKYFRLLGQGARLVSFRDIYERIMGLKRTFRHNLRQ